MLNVSMLEVRGRPGRGLRHPEPLWLVPRALALRFALLALARAGVVVDENGEQNDGIADRYHDYFSGRVLDTAELLNTYSS